MSRRRIRAVLTAGIAVGVLSVPGAPALADPQNPTDEQLGRAAATV